ncbi:MAG: hypothetical protein MUC49_13670 [Raineya sp.]|jgi:hypothetical protein|nr:hypothetical protein [Raineya sp.]
MNLIKDFDFNINSDKLPVNLYALRIQDEKIFKIYEICVKHNGFCPIIETERDQSMYIDYFCNLEWKVVDEFFKTNKLKKPKIYCKLLEVMTDKKGDLYRVCYEID